MHSIKFKEVSGSLKTSQTSTSLDENLTNRILRIKCHKNGETDSKSSFGNNGDGNDRISNSSFSTSRSSREKDEKMAAYRKKYNL